MRTHSNETLEINVVLEKLSDFALSETAKEKLLALRPFMSEHECKMKMNETTEAVKIMESFGTPPLTSMKELTNNLELASKGSMLIPEQLTNIAGFIFSCKRMKGYLKKAEPLDLQIAFYGRALNDLTELYEEIDRSIHNGAVENEATTALRDIRRKIDNSHLAIKAKLESILKSKKEWFADGYVATRNGRFVLPVKKEYKNQVVGTVIDTSSTGSTCFIEPSSVRKLQDELSHLQIEEDNEIRKILYTLTALVDAYGSELKINIDCMETLDFAFAKAKLSMQMKASPVLITTERRIKIVSGRHPLLKQETCVPLNFEIGTEAHGVVITGPNTGGKTVALKTVGLLSIMAQSGLHVPVEEGSVFSMHDVVLSDIGDGQSITENLSTFSSHITNIISILKSATNESLVLLDELGSGTDPAEGMGLAVAILDELRKKNCLFVATTHYPQIKEFAQNTNGLINARMEFDRESLQPLYRLEIGEAGESCALYIARRLGFPEHMLKRAQKEAYGHGKKENHSDNTHNDNQNFITTSENVLADEAVKEKQASVKGKIQREVQKSDSIPRSEKFNIGDSVTVYPQNEIGIVYKRANERGELGIQVKGKKLTVNHKRIKLLVPASELYPEDYDFSIVFDSVANRKARHNMGKKHNPNLIIKLEEN